ncbi:MAG: M16 family metallopeptidase [Bacteroidota bacterium]
MISFEKATLNNGLKIILNQDKTTPIITLNLLYNVGSRFENPNKTGFAHLFEHLMFGGSKNIPEFDTPLEKVGGDNNAFTNTDITNYFIHVPKPNIETAFWLESDRMLDLAFSEKSLEVQKNVVAEEFRQRYINQPYGDTLALLRDLAYDVHPYQWPTIGKEISHITNATMDDVKSFYNRFYNPDNAILTLSGDVNPGTVLPLIEKWFADIPNAGTQIPELPQEPPQTEKKTRTVTKDIPTHAIYKAWKMPPRMHKGYHACDLITDILANGDSSRLYQNLLKKRKLFTTIDAYITGEMDAGMLIITGNLAAGVKMEDAEKAIDEEVDKLLNEEVSLDELTKVQNKIEALSEFQEISGFNKAYLLSYFELLGDASAINQETKKYRSIKPEDILHVAQEYMQPEQSSVLYYLSKHQA